MRQTRKPEGMVQIAFGSNAEGYPTRARSPPVLFRKPFIEQRIMDGARKGYIQNSTRMHMPDLGSAKTELSSPKAVRMNRDFWPGQYFLKEFLQNVHTALAPPRFSMPTNGFSIQELNFVPFEFCRNVFFESQDFLNCIPREHHSYCVKDIDG